MMNTGMPFRKDNSWVQDAVKVLPSSDHLDIC